MWLFIKIISMHHIYGLKLKQKTVTFHWSVKHGTRKVLDYCTVFQSLQLQKTVIRRYHNSWQTPSLWTCPCGLPYHNSWQTPSHWTCPCGLPYHNSWQTPSLWTCPCGLPYHNSWQTPSHWTCPCSLPLSLVKLFFLVKSKTSCLGSWQSCPPVPEHSNLWIIRHRIKGILLYIHWSTFLVVIIESFLFVVRNCCANWMWHTYLRHIEKHCKMSTHTHIPPFPFCTTNFHIPHALPTFSFIGFGGFLFISETFY